MKVAAPPWRNTSGRVGCCLRPLHDAAGRRRTAHVPDGQPPVCSELAVRSGGLQPQISQRRGLREPNRPHQHDSEQGLSDYNAEGMRRSTASTTGLRYAEGQQAGQPHASCSGEGLTAKCRQSRSCR